jgi:hypothetical protein
MGIRKCKECECSGFVTFLENTNTLTANICPDCIIKGSTYTFSLGDTTFNATKINKPNCFEKGSDTQLNVCGEGVLTIQDTEVQIFENLLFTLHLQETETGNDLLLTTVTGLDQNGVPVVVIILLNIPDDDLLITPCRPLNASTTTTNVPTALENETKNTMITIINGKLEKREF